MNVHYHTVCCSIIKIIKSKQATGLLGHLLQNQVHVIPFIIFHFKMKRKEMNSLNHPLTTTIQWRRRSNSCTMNIFEFCLKYLRNKRYSKLKVVKGGTSYLDITLWLTRSLAPIKLKYCHSIVLHQCVDHHLIHSYTILQRKFFFFNIQLFSISVSHFLWVKKLIIYVSTATMCWTVGDDDDDDGVYS